MEKERMLLQEEEQVRKLLSNCLRREGFQFLDDDSPRQPGDQHIVLVALSVMLTDAASLEEKRTQLLRLTSPLSLLSLVQGQQSPDQEELAAGLLYNVKPLLLEASCPREHTGASVLRNMPDMIFGGLEIRCKQRIVLINGKQVELTRKEFDLLVYLARYQGLVLTRAQLLESVWGCSYDGNIRTVDTHVKRLRAKLRGYGKCITTMRGIGYRLQWKEEGGAAEFSENI